MIIACIDQMWYFIMIFLIGVFLFADTFSAVWHNMLLRGDLIIEREDFNFEDLDFYDRFLKPYLEQWHISFLTALGEFDPSLGSYDESEWLFFFLCAIFNITLLLNLLIAIISQTHADVLATQNENEYSEKVK